MNYDGENHINSLTLLDNVPNFDPQKEEVKKGLLQNHIISRFGKALSNQITQK